MKKLSFIFAIALTCFLPSGKALSNSPAITPDSRFPIPDSRFPIPDSLDQQAQHLYETGQYQEAIPLLEQMISNYTESGDIIGQINSLVNLALVYQTLGDLDQAKQTLSQSFSQLSKLSNTTESQQLQAQILEVQGQVYLSLGQGKKPYQLGSKRVLSTKISET
ncbi:tetratricopeptide repeat protein [Moorena producens]|uniref:tetratricopeptide repeat protein n=1 Tax=Moorena producens TaxID=1155739 RepID=UPI003C7706B2